MLGKRQAIHLQIHQLIDAALILLAFVITYHFRVWLGTTHPVMGEIPTLGELSWLMALLAPFTPIVLEAHGFYNNVLTKKITTSLRQMFMTLVWMGTAIAVCVVFFKWHPGSRFVLMILGFFAGGLLLVREALLREFLKKRLKSNSLREKIIIVGTNEGVTNLLAKMNDDFSVEMEICARVSLEDTSIEEFISILRSRSVARVIFVANHSQFSKLENAIRACEEEGVAVCIPANFIQTKVARPTLDTLGGQPMVVFRSTPEASWELTLKTLFDFVGAICLIILTSPIWLLAILGILISSRGPVFFSQPRSGRNGRVFHMLKFRSMYRDAEQRRAEFMEQNTMDGPVFKLKNDPRIFPFGRFIRRFSIDELPQLLNVLRKEMSLVGPRPLPVYEVDLIAEADKRRRMSVKPGLTCLWQIQGRNSITSFEDWVKLDLTYIDNWSLGLDLKILMLTPIAVIRAKGAS